MKFNSLQEAYAWHDTCPICKQLCVHPEPTKNHISMSALTKGVPIYPAKQSPGKVYADYISTFRPLDNINYIILAKLSYNDNSYTATTPVVDGQLVSRCQRGCFLKIYDLLFGKSKYWISCPSELVYVKDIEVYIQNFRNPNTQIITPTGNHIELHLPINSDIDSTLKIIDKYISFV